MREFHKIYWHGFLIKEKTIRKANYLADSLSSMGLHQLSRIGQ